MSNSSKNIWEFFIYNIRFTLIILCAVVILGFLSIVQIPKESQPDVDIPIVVVTTVFPGATAENVEELVTDILENSLMNLEDVEEITSTSGHGVSSIVILFDVDSDSKEKLNDVKDRIDMAKFDLPEDSEDPTVQKIRLTDLPVVTISLAGSFQIPELKHFAEIIKDETESIPGISQVRIIGGQDREVHIIVNKERLDQYNLGINDVTRAISQSNSDIPIGKIETNGLNYLLNFKGGIKNPDELNTVPITQINGVPVVIHDVATVHDSYAIATSKSKLSLGAKESQQSVSLQVYKTSGGNVIKVVDSFLEKVEKLRTENFPENLTIQKTEDNARYVRDDLRNLMTNGGQTILIVCILLFLFIGFREALLAGLSIPLTFFITFIFLSWFGYSLNFLTLFSLILSLGILVDNSIIVTQSIHAYIQKNKTPIEATIQTLKDFKWSLISGTLTTVFAFVPMLLSSGILGKYIRTIPITVSIVLLSSLFVALGLITAISSYLLKKKNNFDENSLWFVRLFLHKLRNYYLKSLKTFFRIRFLKIYFFLLLIVCFAFSLSLPLRGILKVEMFPQANQPIFYINYELPPETPIETTSFEMEKIETLLQGDSRIESYVVTIGSGFSDGMGGGGSSLSNTGSIIVNLINERSESSSEIINAYENKFKSNITKGKVRLVQNSNGPENTAPVEIKVIGKNLETLDELALRIETLLKTVEGTRGVTTSIDEPNPEFVLHFDRMKAAIYGITTTDLARSLRNGINGIEATKLKIDGDSIDVIVKYSLDTLKQEDIITNRVDISTIENITIQTRFGGIPLSYFINTSLGATRESIQHNDGKRVVKISSYTIEPITAQTIFSVMEERIKNISIPNGYEIKMGGEREDIEKSFNDMFRAMILGILLIAALLVLQFKSFRQAIFILVTIPLSLIGVFPGLAILGLPLTFPGIIGIVALIGIVVNNAIILIDRINEKRIEGASILNAVEEASYSRFDPIFLTTITTVLGILPLALRDETWGPLGWSIVFGLTFSTILTLLVIPLLYEKFARKTVYDIQPPKPPIKNSLD